MEHVDMDTLDERRQSLAKAVVVGGSTTPTSLEATNDSPFRTVDALAPPYDPNMLCRILEHSNSLRQNVDAYATNIDGFGHRLMPSIDLQAENTDAEVSRSIALERFAAGEESMAKPRAREVARRRRELEAVAEAERARLDAFFETCCLDHSFEDLRRRTRQDLEVTGNAYWEIVRNAGGRIARLVHVPAHTVRLMPLEEQPTTVVERARISPVTFEDVPTPRRLRRFVQRQGLRTVFFKAFGDPRVVGRTTGEVYPTPEAQSERRPNDLPASEMVHFAIHSPRSPYGVPRWIGSLLSVLGSRQMEEVNYMYFSNKSVPPLALLVSGGRLSESSIPRVENFIEENLKGKENFHKILILEAEGAGSSDSTKTKIELQPLTDAQQQDALFQLYDERNIDKVGASFRVPRLLRGESKDFNRAVADAQLRFAEDQVFQPERAEFDFFMNHRLFPAMGIRMWRFRSQAPITRDPERLTDSIERLVRVGVLTPEEGRALASDVFNRDFRTIGDDWVKRPLTLTLAGVQTGVADISQPVVKSALRARAREIIALRDELAQHETQLADERMAFLRTGSLHPATAASN